MADRLQELLQQRALIKEHLGWIEGEIAAASRVPVKRKVQTSTGTPAPAPTAPPTSPLQPARLVQPVLPAIATPPRVPDDSDALIARLAAEERTPPVPTKKGCWVFFCVTLVVLGAAAWAALRYFYRE